MLVLPCLFDICSPFFLESHHFDLMSIYDSFNLEFQFELVLLELFDGLFHLGFKVLGCYSSLSPFLFPKLFLVLPFFEFFLKGDDCSGCLCELFDGFLAINLVKVGFVQMGEDGLAEEL